MVAPERVAGLLRLFLPLILGTILTVIGALERDVGFVTIGAGVLGIPGFLNAGASVKAKETPTPTLVPASGAAGE